MTRKDAINKMAESLDSLMVYHDLSGEDVAKDIIEALIYAIKKHWVDDEKVRKFYEYFRKLI